VDEGIKGFFIMDTGKECFPLGMCFLLVFILGYDLDDESACPIFIEGVEGGFVVARLPWRHDLAEFLEVGIEGELLEEVPLGGDSYLDAETGTFERKSMLVYSMPSSPIQQSI
jgi:hypothetical protein